MYLLLLSDDNKNAFFKDRFDLFFFSLHFSSRGIYVTQLRLKKTYCHLSVYITIGTHNATFRDIFKWITTLHKFCKKK